MLQHHDSIKNTVFSLFVYRLRQSRHSMLVRKRQVIRKYCEVTSKSNIPFIHLNPSKCSKSKYFTQKETEPCSTRRIWARKKTIREGGTEKQVYRLKDEGVHRYTVNIANLIYSCTPFLADHLPLGCVGKKFSSRFPRSKIHPPRIHITLSLLHKRNASVRLCLARIVNTCHLTATR